MMHVEQRNPVAEAAIKRRALWEIERAEKVWRDYEAGLITQDEAWQRLES